MIRAILAESDREDSDIDQSETEGSFQFFWFLDDEGWMPKRFVFHAVVIANSSVAALAIFLARD